MRLPDIGLFREYRYLSEPRLSPDGTCCAYAVAQAGEDNSYQNALWLYREGQVPRCLSGLGPFRIYTWDGAGALLFVGEAASGQDKGDTVVYRLLLEGGGPREAFRIPRKVERIERLKKGSYLLLAQWDKQELEDQEAEKKRREAEKDYQVIDELPYWSNGHGFVNGKRSRAYLLAGSGDMSPLTPGELDVKDMRVSKSGRYTAFLAFRCKDGLVPPQAEIWEYDMQEQRITCLLDARYYIDALDYWGDTVVFAGNDGKRHGLNENPWLYKLGRHGGEELLSRWDFTVGKPVLSDCRLGGGNTFKACGDTLYFTSLQGVHCGLYRARLPGGAPELVAPVAGSVDRFDTGGEDIFAVAMVGERLQELYRVGEGGLSRLTAHNDAIYREVWRSAPRHHAFTGSDGVEVDGWAMEPAGYRPGRKYPAVLHIHGGPKGAFGGIYFHEMQVWAAKGWFVLYCNPPGGDGKGNAFADIRGKYGTGDYRALMDFTDHMLEEYPQIDRERLGVAGGSYGGFMTNWIVGHTDRFRVAVSQRCISNWFSFSYVSDIGYYYGKDQIAADAWSGADTLWEKSPLRYANRVKTPTLFIHSDEDYRCWIPEGYQMYTALKLHGVETRMVVFHGENHELSRSGKPGHRVRRLQEITGWLARYLDGNQEGGKVNDKAGTEGAGVPGY